MFDDIGGKIKGLAKLYCWTGIIASVIGGIGLMVSAEDGTLLIIGVLVVGLGSVASWVSSFVLYGFGELVDSTESIYYLVHKMSKGSNHSSSWRCSRCGAENSNDASFCIK